ncbi:MAG: DUF2341 domain-containing protein [Bacteroidia bacterium]
MQAISKKRIPNNYLSQLRIIFLILLIADVLKCQPPGYSYGKQILIQSSQVVGTGTLTDFPILISFTDNDLRTVSNGGHVENANGYDIVFYFEGCSMKLNHQIEKYTASTGEYIAWVQTPFLYGNVNTNIHMYYGNSTVSVDPSTASTWSVGYNGVWHLHSNENDASGNGNNGTNNGSTNTSPSQIADGQNFVDPNHWVELNSHPNVTGNFSYSGWFRSTNVNTAHQRVICDDATNANGCHAISVGDPGTGGRIRFYIRGLNPVSLDSPSGSISNNTWHYVTATYNNTTKVKVLYIDGVAVGSQTVTGTLGTPTGNASIGGEVATGESGNRFNGDIDEVRSIQAVLSPEWIGTEYNNQSSPSTFYSVSAEMSASVLCTTLPIDLIDYKIELNSNKDVSIKWVTASETNCNYFLIEKSENGIDYKSVSSLPSKSNNGFSSSPLEYSISDQNPIEGLNYYQLTQFDFDNTFVRYPVKSFIYSPKFYDIQIFPNPNSGEFKLKLYYSQPSPFKIKIYNSIGDVVFEKQFEKVISKKELDLEFSDILPNGTYMLQYSSDKQVQTIRFIIK